MAWLEAIERSEEYSPFTIAITKGDLAEVKRLYEAGKRFEDRYDNNDTAMHAATFDNKPAIIDFFLEMKEPIDTSNNEGSTPLLWLVRNSNTEYAKKFISLGARVIIDIKGRPMVVTAIMNGNLELTQALFEAGAEKTDQFKGLPPDPSLINMNACIDFMNSIQTTAEERREKFLASLNS